MHLATYIVCGKSDFLIFVDQDEVEVFQDYEKNNDPLGAFSFLMLKLEILFEQKDFKYVQRICEVKNGEYSPAFLNQVKNAKSTNELFIAFSSNHLYCNWLNTRLLKLIATNARISEAVKLIQRYEECFYSKPASCIKQYHYKVEYFITADICVKVLAKINVQGNNTTIKQLIEYVSNLEYLMGLPEGSLNAESLTEFACIELNGFIPSHCSLHAHRMSEKNHFRFRQFHIRYIKIQQFDKVWAMKHSVSHEKFPVVSTTITASKFCFCICIYVVHM